MEKIFFTKTRKTKLFMETSSGFLDLRLFKSLYLGMVWATMGDDVLHRITKRKSFKNLLINLIARKAETCLEKFLCRLDSSFFTYCLLFYGS